MEKKYKFVAEISDKKGISVFEPTRQSKDTEPMEPVFDISSLNLGQLLNNLQESISKKPSRFIFLRNRQNKIIQLETERVHLLTDQVNSVRGLGQEFMELRADAIFQNDLLEMLVQNRRKEFEQLLSLRVEKATAEIEHEKLGIRERTAKVRREEVITDLIDAAINNFANIKPENRDLILAIINPDSTPIVSERASYSELMDFEKFCDIMGKNIENQKSQIELENLYEKFKKNYGR